MNPKNKKTNLPDLDSEPCNYNEINSISQQINAAEAILEQAINSISDKDLIADSEVSDIRFLFRDYMSNVRKWYDGEESSDDVVSMLGLRTDYDLEELSQKNIFY
jgi:hypothetical protein